MSIMEKMRGSTDSTPMQVVLILIVVAFVGWYALPQGEQVNVALEVDGQRILMPEFGPRYNLAKALEGAGGRDMTAEREREVWNLVKQEMARDLVMAREATRLGFQVSPEEISRVIKSDPRYFNEEGKFDLALWKDAIKGSGRSRGDVEDSIRRELLRDKLRAVVTLGVGIDERAARTEYDELMKTIDVDYLVVDRDVVAGSAHPRSLSDFRAANAERVRKAYDDQRAARFEKPAQVGLQVIRLKVGSDDRDAIRARLDTIRAEALGGADFAALARRWSEDPATVASGGELGDRRVDAMTANLRAAVGELPVGGVSEPVDEMDRLAVYRVASRQDATVVPFEAVELQLASELHLEELAAERVRALAAAWVDLPPVELMTELGIELQSLEGVPPAHYEGGVGKPPRELLTRAAASAPGTVLEPFAVPNGDGQRWFVARMFRQNEADSARFPEFVAGRLAMARGLALERYEGALQAASKVDMREGTVTQGGWQDWFKGILPSSGG
jgi:peptidyl-prolyl cis-trans isomerase D